MSNLSEIIKNGFRTCGLSPFLSAGSVNFDILNEKRDEPSNDKEKEETMKHLQYFENILDAEHLEDFRSAIYINKN